MRSFSKFWQNFECLSFAHSFHHFLLTKLSESTDLCALSGQLELWILLSDALPLSHRDSIVSEVYYKEVYYEVPSSIPHGDSNFFLCHKLLTTQKHLSLVQWKFKRGQLFAALDRFENSSNTDAAIQIFLCGVLTHSRYVIFVS